LELNASIEKVGNAETSSKVSAKNLIPIKGTSIFCIFPTFMISRT